MEKIYLRPNAEEILIKGSASEGASDVFAYQGESSDAARHLGSLYVVGNVQHQTDDMAYATNLIAALAKREYYSHTGDVAKEAFAGMLKKVNEVVEEFFKHDGLKINVGIFTIAGDKISISKLGKFKILLGRDSKVIDVLNNVEHFGKEHASQVQTQFSSVITGSIHEGDRLFAFYPGRGVSTREKTFKEHLPKLAAAEFIEKLNAIKAQKEAFACAAVYVDFEKVREVAVAPNIQPQELTEEEEATPAVLAAESTPTIRSSPTPAAKTVSTQSQHTPKMAKVAAVLAEIPRIIPSEFSLGRKENIFTNTMHQFRLVRMTPQIRAVLTLSVVAIIVITILVVQSSSFLNPQAKAVNEAVSEARTQLDLAKTRISQNDTAQARTILTASISSLSSFGETDEKNIGAVTKELTTVLDEIDQAEPAHLVAPTSIPSGLTNVGLLAASENMFGIAGTSTASGSSSYIAALVDGELKVKDDTGEVRPDTLFTDGTGITALDQEGKQIFNQYKGKAKAYTLDTIATVVAAGHYENNLYVLHPTDIVKIPDISKGAGGGKSWLTEGTELVDDPALIAIDGNVYVMSDIGTLVTYYRGEKVREVNSNLIPTKNSRLLTTNDEHANLFLVDRINGRIYVIDKKTGSLAKTLVVDSALKVLDAYVADGTILYLLTSDEKIWQVE